MSSSGPTQVLLVRHAESSPSRDVPEPDWPLSPAGVMQSQELARRLASLGISALFASPYRRAVATLEPLAAIASLEIVTEPDLRERKLTDGFHPDHQSVARQAWADLDFALPSCETGIACQQRVRAAVDRLAAEHPGETIALASHGNAIALYLRSLDGKFGYREWSGMRNPDVFAVDYASEATPAWDEAFELR